MIDQKTLKQQLDYNPDTGIFTWRKRSESGKKKNYMAGKQAGYVSADGYIRICVNQKMYLAHRLAWLYVNGWFPPEQLDHIDGNNSNNVISNLRMANQSLNNGNTRMHTNNSTGFKGVTKNGTGYGASIRINGVRHHLGTYNSPEEAHAAYCAAAPTIFGEFARTR